MQLITRHRWFLLLLLLTTLAAVVTTVWLTETYALNPCPLCIFQRVLLLIIALLAFLGIVFPSVSFYWLALALITALGGMATSGYQSYIQWVPSATESCNVGQPNLIEQLVDQLGLWVPRLFEATGFCSSKELELLKLSLANWAFIFFLLLAVVIVFYLKATKKGKHRIFL